MGVSGPYTESFSYNQIGNIMTKNGASYTYGTKPHAVTTVKENYDSMKLPILGIIFAIPIILVLAYDLIFKRDRLRNLKPEMRLIFYIVGAFAGLIIVWGIFSLIVP
jgi:hypothetical protein